MEVLQKIMQVLSGSVVSKLTLSFDYNTLNLNCSLGVEISLFRVSRWISTVVCLCDDKEIYKQSFLTKSAFLIKHRIK